MFVRCDACLQADEKYYQILSGLKCMESGSRQIRITARAGLSDVTRKFLIRSQEHICVSLLMYVRKQQREHALT